MVSVLALGVSQVTNCTRKGHCPNSIVYFLQIDHSYIDIMHKASGVPGLNGIKAALIAAK